LHLVRYGANMAVVARETWTDERLDDLRENVNQRFDEVDKKIDNLDRRTEAGFAEVREEFRALRTELSHLTYGLIGTMLVGFLGTIVALVTQT
jgi:predicted nuclease with TOPRIM domain